MDTYTKNDKWLEILNNFVMIYLGFLGLSFLLIGNADSQMGESSILSMIGISDSGLIFFVWFIIGIFNIGLIFIVWKVIYSFLEDVKIIKKEIIRKKSIDNNNKRPKMEHIQVFDQTDGYKVLNHVLENTEKDSKLATFEKTVNEIPAKPVMHTESEKLNQQLLDLLKQYKKGDIPNEYYENAKSYIEQKIAELEND